MKKFIKYGVRVLVVLILLIVLLWTGIWAYVRFNKAGLISKISAKITEKTKGPSSIGDLSANVLQTFPFVSIELTNVLVKDSLWQTHNRTFFAANKIYLRLSPFGLLNKDRGIGKILVTGGKLHIYFDSTQFTNQYILRSENPGRKSTRTLPNIQLLNSQFILENPSRQKYHHFDLTDFKVDTEEKDEIQVFDIDTDMLVKSLAFNTKKGSYLKNKRVRGLFQLTVDRLKKQLSFSDVNLMIEGQRFNLAGRFSVDTANRGFQLTISSTRMNFNKTIQLLPDSMRLKLHAFSMEKPVSGRITVQGETRYRFLPLVNIAMEVRNNTVKTPGGTFTNCSFSGRFNNQLKIGDPRLDMNSVMELKNFAASFEKIAVTSKIIRVSNLRNPYLECDIKSSFALVDLNELTGSTTLQFEKGKGAVDIAFKGPISGRDSVDSGINGFISINNGTIRYIPRNVTLNSCTGNFIFRDKDLTVEKFAARTGDTELTMNGEARNFLSLLNISPEKLVLRWNVYSPQLHLKDFKSFLAKRKISAPSRKANDNFKKTAGKIDKMFTDGDVFVTLSSPKMNYKKFDAKKVDAQVLLTNNRIDLKNVSFGHANGSMKIVGTVTEGVTSNAVYLNSILNKMDIPSLFYAFGDFGQDAITTKNLNGIVSAVVNLNTAITDEAEVIPESMMGTIDFLVENGELNDFEPLKKISLSVFKKQDFSTIKFADLKNRLNVKGTAIIIDKMEIRSTALILFAEGVYDVKKGTDMSIKFPIRNIIKKNDSVDLISSDIRTGPSIRVRAKTGDDGKLKISWDPLRRAVRNKKETEAN